MLASGKRTHFTSLANLEHKENIPYIAEVR
jgi:hypothetical protein